MNRFVAVLVAFSFALSPVLAEAKGGVSSGGFSGGGRSFSGGGSSFFGGSKGGFSSSSPSASAPRSSTTTTTTTNVTRNTSINRSYGGGYVRSGGYYGGWGMGYGYNNGIMTGLILGSMMHPYGSVMYMGPGSYYNNALLYPNGQVVNQQGYVVGTYQNNVFAPVANGPMVAQPVPDDAYAPAQPGQAQQQGQPVQVLVQQPDYTGYYLGTVVFALFVFIVFLAML